MVLFFLIIMLLATRYDTLTSVHAAGEPSLFAATAPPHPPAQPATGPGGADYAHQGYTVTQVSINTTPNDADDYWVFQPTDPQPATAPLVVFNHGFNGLTPQVYLGWIEHLTKKGNIVIFPKYQQWEEYNLSTFLMVPTYTPLAIAAVKDGIGWLNADPADRVQPDLEQFAIVGHSLGAVITVNMANRWYETGLPEPKVVMPVQPFAFSYVDVHLTGIPSTVVMNCVVGDQDRLVNQGGCDLIWARTGHIPLENRDYVMMVSDTYGEPDLIADHSTASGAAPDLDALDWYGLWKSFDGLCNCRFTGIDCAYGLGNTVEHRFMGVWSDGVPVHELQITDSIP